MTFNTSKFDAIEIEDEKIIEFEYGILGFEDLKRYVLLKMEELLPFYWLQSIDDKDVALPCMNPFDIAPSYKPSIDEAVLDSIGVQDEKDIIILTIVVVPKDPAKATTNMAAPIIINTANNKGIQYILQDDDYNIRQPVFLKKEDTHYADTYKEAK